MKLHDEERESRRAERAFPVQSRPALTTRTMRIWLLPDMSHGPLLGRSFTHAKYYTSDVLLVLLPARLLMRNTAFPSCMSIGSSASTSAGVANMIGCDIVSICCTTPLAPIFFRLSVIRDIIITFERRKIKHSYKESVHLVRTVTLMQPSIWSEYNAEILRDAYSNSSLLARLVTW